MRDAVDVRDLFFDKSDDATQGTVVVNEAASKVYWTIDLYHR